MESLHPLGTSASDVFFIIKSLCCFNFLALSCCSLALSNHERPLHVQRAARIAVPGGMVPILNWPELQVFSKLLSNLEHLSAQMRLEHHQEFITRHGRSKATSRAGGLPRDCSHSRGSPSWPPSCSFRSPSTEDRVSYRLHREGPSSSIEVTLCMPPNAQ